MKNIVLALSLMTLSLNLVSCKKKTFVPQPDPIENTDTTVVTSDSLSRIVINVTGMKNINGKLNVALYNTSASFNDPNAAFREQFLVLPSQSMTVTIDSLPAGTYAFALFHDENDNQTLDQNFLNIPQEGFAFSNNSMGTFGPPTFNQAKFNLPKNSTATQNISLRFL